jgi:acetyltransferase
LIVQDKWHNKSIGTQLLNKLVHIAKQEKLSSIQAKLLKENTSMQAICKKAGFKLTAQDDQVFAEIKFGKKRK